MGTGTRQIEVVEILAIWRHHRGIWYAVRILPVGCLWSEERAERLSVRWRRILPIRPDRTPALAKAFFVGVAVLRDDGSDPFRVADGEPEACRCAVVEHVQGKPIEINDLGKAVDHTGNVIERVTEVFSRRHIGLTEPGKVRRDDMKPVSEERDQVTEHVAGAREAVQQQELRRLGRPRLAIEHLEAIDISRAVLDRRHYTGLSNGLPSAAGYGADCVTDYVSDSHWSGDAWRVINSMRPNGRPHPFRHVALGLGDDHSIVFGNQKPARD